MKLGARIPLSLAAGAAAVAFAATAASAPVATLCYGLTPTLPVGAATGTPGNDVIVGTAGNNVVNAGAGDDTICVLGGNDRVNLGAGNDRANLGLGNDVAVGGAGNELRIDGGGGNDVINVGPGNDLRISGDGGNDVLTLGPGNDSGRGALGADRIFGNAGDDVVRGGDGDDLLNGGPGRDRGFGDAGHDVCLQIEVTVTCEEGPGGETKVTVEIKQTSHYHPPGADSSFACALVQGTDGALYVVVARGNGIQNGATQERGTFDDDPELIVIPIFAAGDITFEVRATLNGVTATDTETFNVPTPGPPANQGSPSCRE